MKFLHTADLHLDSAFCSDGQIGAEARRQRQRELLGRIFGVARERECDMVLIAGDLFDSALITPETRELCLSLFEHFGGPVVIAPGNHDAYVDGCFYKMENMPSNVHIFTSGELQYFDFPELDTTVAGYAFTSAAMPHNPLSAPLPVRHNQRIILLCAHTEIDNPTSRYAPTFESDVVRGAFDYAALGHVHSCTAMRENIRYCGIPEGRGFDETGEGCVLLVETDGISSPTVEKINVSRLRYVRADLSVDGECEPEAVENMIESKLTELASEGTVAVRLELVGTLAPEALPDLGAIESRERQGVCELELIDSTLSLPDKSHLEKDTTLKGEFYRSLCSQLYSEDPHKRALALRALRIGLAAIEGKSITDGGRA